MDGEVRRGQRRWHRVTRTRMDRKADREGKDESPEWKPCTEAESDQHVWARPGEAQSDRG